MSGSSASEKTPITYLVQDTGAYVPGEKCKRAYLEPNGRVNLARFAQTMSGDHGRMAGRASHVKSTVISICEGIHDELMKGNAVTIDDYLRLTPTLRGKVDPETGRPTSESVLGVAVQVLRRMKLDIAEFDLVNGDRTASEPRFTELYTIGLSAVRDQIVRGAAFHIGGRNLYFDVATGDTIVLSYTEEGETQSIALTPTACNPGLLMFAWPAALAEVAAGTEVTVTLRTRMGVKDGAFYTASRTATLVEP